MPSDRVQLNRQPALIYAVIFVGLVAIGSSNREKNSLAYGTPQVEDGRVQLCGSGVASWDRYGLFRFAYRQAIKRASDSFSVSDFVMSGSDLQLKKEGISDAITTFLCDVKSTPEEDGAWSDLAWLYAISGDTSEAITTEQKAVVLYRFDYTYYVLLGAFLERSRRFDEALDAYGQALVLYPRLVNSAFWHALQLRRPAIADGAMHFALSALDHSQLVVDDVTRNEVRARLLAANGLLEDADNIVNSINAQLPNLSGMWELQGELHERDGRIANAILDYRRAKFLDSEDPVPHERLATLELDLSNAENARIEALLAWRLAQHPWSPGAARRKVQYQRDDHPRNGELPVTLLTDTQPSFRFESMFTRLSRLFASQGKEERAREMELKAYECAHSELH